MLLAAVPAQASEIIDEPALSSTLEDVSGSQATENSTSEALVSNLVEPAEAAPVTESDPAPTEAEQAIPVVPEMVEEPETSTGSVQEAASEPVNESSEADGSADDATATTEVAEQSKAPSEVTQMTSIEQSITATVAQEAKGPQDDSPTAEVSTDDLPPASDIEEIQYPEGSEDWDASEWEAFYETPEGEEFLAQFEPSDEDIKDDLAFWEGIADRLPSDVDSWGADDWEEYFETDEGRQIQFEYLAFLLDNASDEEYDELLNFLDENYDSEWLDAFALFYFGAEGSEEDGTGNTDQQPSDNEDPVDTEGTEPKDEVEIQPAGNIDEKPATEDTNETASKVKPQATAQNELADTGFDSLAVAGIGAMLALSGAFFVGQRRKNVAK
ncbi:LPXTG cell wall anchor domain-containing protein [Glutamicibacter sp.]|uniref:LPXTG cell wall anchor domain-containing protein n=1 Tax=Glutamicibacter sp. TaxID=1931995 RepID=UPI0028BF0549|nr:LPXTG cell wall anchor domain-containing protein [Glutamicibacter sp.]